MGDEYLKINPIKAVPVERADTDGDNSYWKFLLSFFIALMVCELILAPMHSVYPAYSSLIGYVGLAIEATLPLPQILTNARSRSCKGFRFSVLASWLLGDAMKMFWFFTSSSSIPWAFKLSGMFQACCDAFLGVQYLMYGAGETEIKDHQLSNFPGQGSRIATGREIPGGRRTPVVEKMMI